MLKTGEIRSRYRKAAILLSIPALAVILLAGTGLFPQAYASSVQQVVGNCPNTSPCGTVSCVAGPVNSAAFISFSVMKTAGVVTGTYDIGAAVFKDGSINVLRFDSDHDSFTLKGIELVANGCAFPQTLPSAVTISGNCGSSVTITYKAANGETGKFVGNVACV